MSSWKIIVKDFPERLGLLLDNMYNEAKRKDLEVTFMLGLASQLIVVPHERFDNPVNPSADRSYVEARDKYRDLLKEEFFLSHVKPNNEEKNSWRYGQTNRRKLEQQVENWFPSDIDTRFQLGKLTVDKLITIMRNALAHGSVFVDAVSENNISEIIFVNALEYRKMMQELNKAREEEKKEFVPEPSNKFEFISLPPETFKAFLERWIEVLKTLNFNRLPSI